MTDASMGSLFIAAQREVAYLTKLRAAGFRFIEEPIALSPKPLPRFRIAS